MTSDNAAKFNDMLVDLATNKPGSQREGQWTFNCVHSHFPDAANKFRATQHDPFHDDDKADEFIALIWKELEG